MDLQLKGKKAVVTGSTAGIGLAIASALAKERAAVVINGRTKKRVDDAIAQLKKDHKNIDIDVTGVAADLGTAAGVETLLKAVPSADILINNLGIFEPKAFAEITDADWMKFFEVNVLSGVRLSRAYLPKMLSNNWGRIIFISSESGVQIPAEMIQYGMTKTAQIAVARGIAEATAGTNVTINSVLPGPTRSEGAEEFLSRMATERKADAKTVEAEFFRTIRPTSLLKRFIEPGEVASMVAYLCSPMASATNGAALRVDGGVVRAIV